MNQQSYNLEEINKSFQKFAEQYEALRNKYRITVKITKDEAERNERLEEGMEVQRNPLIPSNPKDAFLLFTEYYASVHFELQKKMFFEKYRIVNEASVNAELKELDLWIQQAKEENYSDACKSPESHNKRHEYLRLVNGFYQGYQMSWVHHQENSMAATVYGKYVLFYNHLKSIAEQLKESAEKPKRDRADFTGWLFLKPAWDEIAFQHNTGRGYQHKQDLLAVFGTSFNYLEDKLNNYLKEFGKLPFEVLEDEKLRFRKAFPLSGRIGGVPYYDELIDQFIERHHRKQQYQQPKETPKDFYIAIVNKLFSEQRYIGETFFPTIPDFIEAMHEQAPYKGKVYYTNLIINMPGHWGTKIRKDIFQQALKYCHSKATPEIDFHPDELEPENNFIDSTIEDYLTDVKDLFEEVEFRRAKTALSDYFHSRKSTPSRPIVSSGNSKVRVAMACGAAFKAVNLKANQKITYEYLAFLKASFVQLSEEDIDSKPLNSTNLYKYCTKKS